MFATVLGSGSKGNSTLIESGKSKILIDAGLSLRQTKDRLGLCGVRPEEISAIVITHDHGDHIDGLKSWPNETQIHANPATMAGILAKNPRRNIAPFDTGSRIRVAGFEIDTFPVPHDAADTAGFLINGELGFLTDLGFISRLVLDQVAPAKALIVESNYDDGMLMDSRRPFATKQRIRSNLGHLSNAQAAQLIDHLASKSLRLAVLCHLSGECNTQELASETCSRSGIPIHTSTQGSPSSRFAI